MRPRHPLWDGVTMYCLDKGDRPWKPIFFPKAPCSYLKDMYRQATQFDRMVQQVAYEKAVSPEKFMFDSVLGFGGSKPCKEMSEKECIANKQSCTWDYPKCYDGGRGRRLQGENGLTEDTEHTRQLSMPTLPIGYPGIPMNPLVLDSIMVPMPTCPQWIIPPSTMNDLAFNASQPVAYPCSEGECDAVSAGSAEFEGYDSAYSEVSIAQFQEYEDKYFGAKFGKGGRFFK